MVESAQDLIYIKGRKAPAAQTEGLVFLRLLYECLDSALLASGIWRVTGQLSMNLLLVSRKGSSFPSGQSWNESCFVPLVSPLALVCLSVPSSRPLNPSLFCLLVTPAGGTSHGSVCPFNARSSFYPWCPEVSLSSCLLETLRTRAAPRTMDSRTAWLFPVAPGRVWPWSSLKEGCSQGK